jgi:hypothetical protein
MGQKQAGMLYAWVGIFPNGEFILCGEEKALVAIDYRDAVQMRELAKEAATQEGCKIKLIEFNRQRILEEFQE